MRSNIVARTHGNQEAFHIILVEWWIFMAQEKKQGSRGLGGTLPGTPAQSHIGDIVGGGSSTYLTSDPKVLTFPVGV